MNTEALFISFNEIDDELLERSEKTEHKKSVIKIKWLLSASCFGILALAVILINGLNLPDKLSSIFPTEEYTDYTNPFNDNPAFGDEPAVVTSIDKNLSVTQDTQLNLPLFVNPYPMGHGGAEYVVDDNIEALVNNNLNSFLSVLGIPVVENTLEFNNRSANMQGFLTDGEHIIASPTHIAVVVDEETPFNYNMADDELIAAIKENVYLTAMCRYLEITSPVINVEITKNFDNEIYDVSVKIYQNDDDISQRILNSELNCVKLIFNKTGYSCICSFKDTSTTISGQMLSFSEAAEKAAVDIEKGLKACTVMYLENIVSGYHMPCYVFVVKDIEYSMDGYLYEYPQYVVPMYDIEAIQNSSSLN